MTWVMVAVLAVAAFAALALVFKVPRRAFEAVGSALLLGIAGFALQARPQQPGAPKPPALTEAKGGAELVAARQALASDPSAPPASWITIADAFARNGQYSDAAGVLLGAVEKDPKNADAWLALGNALIAHADGQVTPAALHAYSRAAKADPAHPGPSFFLGLALAQNGRLEEGRGLWADLLARSPAEAPWRQDLAERLARLDAFMAAQAQTQAQAGTGPAK
jgi:cytochrome c-type biogenesis protein CcmH